MEKINLHFNVVYRKILMKKLNSMPHNYVQLKVSTKVSSPFYSHFFVIQNLMHAQIRGFIRPCLLKTAQKPSMIVLNALLYCPRVVDQRS